MSFIGAGFGFESIKAEDAIVAKPGFEGFPAKVFSAAGRDLPKFSGHFFKMASLALGAIMQDRSNDGIAEEGDFLGHVFFAHKFLHRLTS